MTKHGVHFRYLLISESLAAGTAPPAGLDGVPISSPGTTTQNSPPASAPSFALPVLSPQGTSSSTAEQPATSSPSNSPGSPNNLATTNLNAGVPTTLVARALDTQLAPALATPTFSGLVPNGTSSLPGSTRVLQGDSLRLSLRSASLVIPSTSLGDVGASTNRAVGSNPLEPEQPTEAAGAVDTSEVVAQEPVDAGITLPGMLGGDLELANEAIDAATWDASLSQLIGGVDTLLSRLSESQHEAGYLPWVIGAGAGLVAIKVMRRHQIQKRSSFVLAMIDGRVLESSYCKRP
jgi:hypothetical protein